MPKFAIFVGDFENIYRRVQIILKHLFITMRLY